MTKALLIMLLKKLIKLIFRYSKSVFWYFVLKIFGKKFKTNKKFRTVYIICPGPSLNNFKKRKFEDNCLCIFINHSLKISNEFDCNKILFTGDTTRANEILQYKSEIEHIISIGHFFQLNFNVLRKFKFIIPDITFSNEYGIIGKQNNILKFDDLGKSISAGFGSFVNGLSFSLWFRPSIIKIVGSDFGYKSEKKYSFEFDGINSNTPFERIKLDYFKVRSIIEKNNIIVENIINN